MPPLCDSHDSMHLGNAHQLLTLTTTMPQNKMHSIIWNNPVKNSNLNLIKPLKSNYQLIKQTGSKEPRKTVWEGTISKFHTVGNATGQTT